VSGGGARHTTGRYTTPIYTHTHTYIYIHIVSNLAGLAQLDLGEVLRRALELHVPPTHSVVCNVRIGCVRVR
jgi:hypothetical protein